MKVNSRSLSRVLLAAAVCCVPGAFDEASAQMQCTAIRSGLVAWYPGNGDTADHVGGNTGTLENGAGFGPGIIDQAFSLDGLDDFVSAPTSDEIDPTSAGSIAAWVNLAELPSTAGHIMEVVGKGTSGRDFDVQVDPDDRFRFYIAAGSHAASTTIATVDTWNHVAGTWDSAIGIRLFVNGVLEGENPTQVSREASGLPLLIGDQPAFGPRRLSGLIDDVKIFNRALTDEEVAALACAAPSDCGDTDDNGLVVAGDALTVLRRAVGQSVECPALRCDADANGAITASDALRVLKFAVEQKVVLTCPADED